MKNKPLSKSSAQTYSALKNKIKRVIEQAEKSISDIKLRTYWETGRLIEGHIEAQGNKAGYGQKVIFKLAEDLEMNQSQLYKASEFYRTYPILATSPKLGWSHYRALLSVNNSSKRKALEAKASRNGWSVRELRGEIRAQARKAGQPTPSSKKLKPLKRKVGELNVTAYQGQPAYDLGFSFYHISKKAKRLKKNQKRTFAFNAVLDRVIDGDTVWAHIDLGFGMWTKQKLRLRGIDSPELKTKKGKQAKKFLEEVLKGEDTFQITTTKSDKYDRYLVDIFLGTLFVNQCLVEEHHARIV